MALKAISANKNNNFLFDKENIHTQHNILGYLTYDFITKSFQQKSIEMDASIEVFTTKNKKREKTI